MEARELDRAGALSDDEEEEEDVGVDAEGGLRTPGRTSPNLRPKSRTPGSSSRRGYKRPYDGTPSSGSGKKRVVHHRPLEASGTGKISSAFSLAMSNNWVGKRLRFWCFTLL